MATAATRAAPAPAPLPRALCLRRPGGGRAVRCMGIYGGDGRRRAAAGYDAIRGYAPPLLARLQQRCTYVLWSVLNTPFSFNILFESQ